MEMCFKSFFHNKNGLKIMDNINQILIQQEEQNQKMENTPNGLMMYLEGIHIFALANKPCVPLYYAR